MNDLRIIDINDKHGEILAPEWLRAAEAVHRELRPQLPKDYPEKMRRVFAAGGRMSVAARGEVVLGVAVFRVYENTFEGVQMYVDDLVTHEAERSSGVGKGLLHHLQELARRAGCAGFNLDSGVQRQQAHKFYFREGMAVSAFHFSKRL